MQDAKEREVSVDIETTIHPDDFEPITEEMREKAEYPVRFTFPKEGEYLIAVD